MDIMCINQSINQSIDRSFNQSINYLINHLLAQKIHQTVRPPSHKRSGPENTWLLNWYKLLLQCSIDNGRYNINYMRSQKSTIRRLYMHSYADQ